MLGVVMKDCESVCLPHHFQKNTQIRPPFLYKIPFLCFYLYFLTFSPLFYRILPSFSSQPSPNQPGLELEAYWWKRAPQLACQRLQCHPSQLTAGSMCDSLLHYLPPMIRCGGKREGCMREKRIITLITIKPNRTFIHHLQNAPTHHHPFSTYLELLLRPIASTSSMYKIHGLLFLASLNKSLTLAAPKPGLVKRMRRVIEKW